ncbi:tripartite tricarboxylate transporter substrate binding protein [Cuneatibacter sp. NSJ-177]|uniref:Bug family tripartite tricarboxylate transporter substrate binding protein n=1 Tax=Cuneatibacter sp. NSJ-177 TaxID=2931401 RepID=UPI001FD4D1AD|nr:tripartite tricarboxylate transporter substrate binding protein [Cuneatibacter sp. NSJ-177]MCJ7837023.1 tripartite tricarboxylate transporter substrate binding protein [Cuneatibacter sp. NSJ-177]
MRARKVLAAVLALTMGITVLSACDNSAAGTTAAPANKETSKTETSGSAGKADQYPDRDINGDIIYGAGGGTDLISRAMGAALNEVLDVSVIMDNKAGGSGVVGTEYVLSQEANGYDICFHSEAITMFQPMELSEAKIDDFSELMLYGSGAGVLLVSKDSPYQTIEDLIAYAKEHPKELNIGNTGATGCPTIYCTMMQKILGVEFNYVNYDGDGEAMTALMGNQIDLFIPVNFTAQPYVESGDLRPLLVFHDEKVNGFEDVKLATGLDAQFQDYLPYGPFFGAAVSAKTDPEIVKFLMEKFTAAYDTDSFQNYLTSANIIPTKYVGEEAAAYMKDAQAKVWTLLYEAGTTSLNPADYGVMME